MINKPQEHINGLGFITWMQVIGCFLVVLGHSYPFESYIPNWAIQLRTFIYDFHMPIFVWCSGYLIIATNQVGKYTFGQYLKHRAIRILVPYFVFSLIGVIPKILLSSVLNDTMSFNILDIIRSFFVPRESIWGHFWFLPMIFFLSCVSYLVVFLLINRPRMGGGITCVLLIIGVIGYFMPKTTDWFAINDIVRYFVYSILGLICATVKFNLGKYKVVISIISTAIAILGFILLPHNKAVSFAISILMLVSIWFFAILINDKITINRKAVYAQTFSIFILSWPCQLIIEIILERILYLPFVIVFPSMLLVGLVAPLVVICLVNLLERKSNKKIISTIIGL